MTPSVSASGGSTSSRTQEFMRMKPPVFTGAKAEEDPQNFIDTPQKVFHIQLQDVAHIWCESWEQSRGKDTPPATWDECENSFLDYFMQI